MTVYRMVRTLESLAFLVRDPATNRYRLGPATLAMIYVSKTHTDLLTHCPSLPRDSGGETGESVTLAIEVDGIPVCIDMINSSRPFKRETAPGRIIGDCLGPGKTLLRVQARGRERDHPCSRLRRGSHCRGKPLDRAVVEADLEQIRRDDVAFDIEGLYTVIFAPSDAPLGTRWAM